MRNKSGTRLKLFILALVLCFTILPNSKASAESVQIPYNITEWVLDEENGYIYAVSQESHKLMFIEKNVLHIEGSLYLTSPTDIEMSGGKLYIPLFANRQVAVVDVATRALERTINLQNEAYKITIDGDRLFYTGCEGYCIIYEYNLTTNLETTILTGHFYQPDIVVDPANHVLYIGESGKADSNIYAMNTLDFSIIGRTNYDRNDDVINHPHRKILFDGSSIFMGGIEYGLELRGINGTYMERNNTDKANILYVKNEYVFADKALYDRNKFVITDDLLYTASLLLMDNDNFAYAWDASTRTLHKDTYDLFIDPVMNHENHWNRVVLDKSITDWTNDNDYIYAISKNENKLLYIRIYDLVVIEEKFIGSLPSDIQLHNGDLYIALSGATRMAVTGTAPDSEVNIINLDVQPYRIVAGNGKIFYTEEKGFCRVGAYDINTKEIKPNIIWGYYYHEPDLEFCEYSKYLFIGESGKTACKIYVINTSYDYYTDMHFLDNYLHDYPARKIYYDGYIYYAGYRYGYNGSFRDSFTAQPVLHASGEHIYTPDAVYDRYPLTKICDLHYQVDLAATVFSTLFTYNNETKTIYKYNNPQELFYPCALFVENCYYALSVGDPANITVTAFYIDGGEIDVTSKVEYCNFDPQIISVSPEGEITALFPGFTTIDVLYLGQFDQISVDVFSNVLHISLEGTDFNITDTSLLSFPVYAYYMNGDIIDVSAECSYEISDPSIVSLERPGEIRGLKPGTATLSVTFQNHTIFVEINVRRGIVHFIFDSGSSSYTLPAGTSHQITVSALYSDGNIIDVTDSAYFESTAYMPQIALVNANGLIETHGPGTITVQVYYDDHSEYIDIIVTSPALSSITLDSGVYNLPAGLTRQITVTATYTDGSTQSVTNSAFYQISEPTLAAIDSAGIITGLVPGITTLTVTYQDKTATAQIIVEPPVLTGISPDAASYSMPAGLTQNVIVTATYSDNSTQNVTGSAAYQIADPNIATVDSFGKITGLVPGTTTLIVTYQDKTADAQVIVGQPLLTEISLDSTGYIVREGSTHNIIVTAVYSDGSTNDVTPDAAYQISDPAIASVIPVGVLQGLAGGTTVLIVNYQGMTATAQVTVEALPRLTFFDGFESNTFSSGGWTNSGCEIQKSYKYGGNYAVRFNNSDTLTKSLSTAGFGTIQISYARMTSACESNDHFIVEWYNGSQWIQLENLTGNSSWAQKTFTLPAGANNNPNFKIRFRTSHNAKSDYAYLDNVEIKGIGL